MNWAYIAGGFHLLLLVLISLAFYKTTKKGFYEREESKGTSKNSQREWGTIQTDEEVVQGS